jgi:hemin uptake protein HemP
MAAKTASDAQAASPDLPQSRGANAPCATSPRVVSSDALLRGESQLAIVHERTVYFLRRTRFGKLILTK